uniref:Uncharacterized protein n=1 Tax=Panagrolaimus sp. PS1159 TaxID=55785 RepID=A0AC35GSM2_9BILA
MSQKSPEIKPYIETKYDGCIQRIMKEWKCEILPYEIGNLEYKCLKDFGINVCSYENAGIIQITFPDEIMVKTFQSKRLVIIRGKTNKISTVDPNGKLFEFKTQNIEGFRSNEDFVRQNKNCIEFCFSTFTIKRSLNNGENGKVTIRVYTNDPNKCLKIRICSEHQSFFVEHPFEEKIIRCTNSEFLCDHLHE